jgi:hypothetical protein
MLSVLQRCVAGTRIRVWDRRAPGVWDRRGPVWYVPWHDANGEHCKVLGPGWAGNGPPPAAAVEKRSSAKETWVMESSDLTQRVQELEDLEAIRRLKAQYCHFADRGFDGAGHDDGAVAALFTDDGIWEGSAETAAGYVAIKATCERFLPFGLHLAINPHIRIDGDRASGSWWGLIPTTDRTGQAIWTAGFYEDEFVRTTEGWRFKHLRFRAAFKTRYEAGWANERFLTRP